MRISKANKKHIDNIVNRATNGSEESLDKCLDSISLVRLSEPEKPCMPKPSPVIIKVNHKKVMDRNSDKFNWYCAGIGFSFGAIFFSGCHFIWG